MKKRNIYLGSFGILLLFLYILKFFLTSALPPDTKPLDAQARKHLTNAVPEFLSQQGWDADRLWVLGSDDLRKKWPPERLRPHFNNLREKYGDLVAMKIVGGGINLPDAERKTVEGAYQLECKFTKGPAYINIRLIPGARYWAIDDFSVEETTNLTSAKI